MVTRSRSRFALVGSSTNQGRHTPIVHYGLPDRLSLLPEGHRARVVWAYVEQADLSRIYAGIKAVECGSGRTPIAPEILFALWLYETVEGVGSARAIVRLTQP